MDGEARPDPDVVRRAVLERRLLQRKQSRLLEERTKAQWNLDENESRSTKGAVGRRKSHTQLNIIEHSGSADGERWLPPKGRRVRLWGGTV